MTAFIIVFLLMRSSTAMNSSGLNTLPCLSPILTSHSSDVSSSTTLVVVFSYCPHPSSMPLLVLPSTAASPSPSLWYCVRNFLQVDEPHNYTVMYLRSILHHLSPDVHPVCCSSLLPEPLPFFPEVSFYSSPDHCV